LVIDTILTYSAKTTLSDITVFMLVNQSVNLYLSKW